MKIVPCIQGDSIWLQTRTGRITASEVADATAMLKRKGKDGREAGDSSAVRETYKAALIAEIMTGRACENFVSKWMIRGTELEGEARAEYEIRNDVMVDTVGFIIHGSIDRSGASPDGLIGINGGLEIKVPKIETHIKWMRAGVLPAEHEPQVMYNIDTAEREWWDFLSYCPEMPLHLQQFKVRAYRNDARIVELRSGVNQCLDEVDVMIEELNKLYPYIAPAPKEEHPDPLSEAWLDAETIDRAFR